MLKKLFFLSLILLIPLAAADPQPEITIEEISEQPATPGELVKVSVVVANDGETDGTFGPISVDSIEGISYSGTTSTLNGSFNLCGGCQRVGSVYLQLENDLNSGSYPVKVTTPSNDISVSKTATLEVDGDVVLTGGLDEMIISQDDKGFTDVEVENVGADTATSSLLRFHSERFSFTPNTISLASLEPGDSIDRNISVVSDENLEAGTKNVNFSVEYTEDSVRKKSYLSGVIRVNDRADLTLDEFEAEELTVGEESRLSVEIENLGPGDAEKLVVETDCSGAEMISSKSFIGNLEESESIPASFRMKPDQRDVSCSIDVSYQDSKTRTFSESSDFTAQEPESRLPLVAAVVVAVLLAVVFLYRRRRNELEEI